VPWRQRLFDLAPWSVKELLVALEARRINRFRRWGDYAAVRRAYALRRYAELSQAELQAWQVQRFNTLAAEARARCPYYRTRLPERIASLADLTQIPVLHKQDVRAHRAEMIAQGYNPRHFWRQTTSGSTGTPLQLLVGREGMRIRFAIIDNYYAWLAGDYGTRRAHIATHPLVPARRMQPPFWVYNRVDNQLHMSMIHVSRATAPAFVAALNEFRPQTLIGYPHTLAVLGQYLAEHGGLAHPPRGVFTNSDRLLPTQREAIEQGFGVPCYDVYGTHETNWLAVHCRQHRYHLLQLSSILEVLDEQDRPVPPGTPGRIVVTDLTQAAFPYIRYDNGDIGTLSPDACTCGWHSALLQDIEGRAQDYIVTPQGRHVNVLGRIAREAHHLVESQIAQTHRDRIVIRVVPLPEFVPSDMRAMLDMAHYMLGDDMRVDWEAVASIPRRGNRGKLQHVVREWEEDGNGQSR
jgi:phenylacetate-CoA ligase